MYSYMLRCEGVSVVHRQTAQLQMPALPGDGISSSETMWWPGKKSWHSSAGSVGGVGAQNLHCCSTGSVVLLPGTPGQSHLPVVIRFQQQCESTPGLLQIHDSYSAILLQQNQAGCKQVLNFSVDETDVTLSLLNCIEKKKSFLILC